MRCLSAASLCALAAVAGCGGGQPLDGAGGGGASGGTGGADGLVVCHEQPDHKPVMINGGDRTMVVLFDDGVLYGWGSNDTGQLDRNAWWAQTTEPVRILGLPCASGAAVGYVGIAIGPGGRAFTWGTEVSDERGDGLGTTDQRFSELELAGATLVSTKKSAVLAVAEGQAYWWGAVGRRSTPTPTQIGGGAVLAAANDVASCIIGADGDVSCWGASVDGVLGERADDAEEPVAIDLPRPATLLSADLSTACAVLMSGEIYCWGSNFEGTLGRAVDHRELPFDPVAGSIAAEGPFSGIVMAPGFRACAWRSTGEVYCWGSNGGVYGPENGTPEGEPRRVPELEPAKQVGLINAEVCSIGFDDVVRCRIPQHDAEQPQEARILDFDGFEPVED